MRKIILSFVCALAILSACEKVTLKDPSSNPIGSNNPADTSKVVPPVVTPPVVVPPVVTPPIVKPPVVVPPVVTPPVVTPPVVVPPVVTPPVIVPPVVTPPVVVPPVVVGLSFAKDVVPVLTLCQNCHKHGWTSSTVASTYYTNLVSKGYVKPAAYTSSIIYTKMAGGHPGSSNISTANTDKIITWMKQGSLNN